MSHWTVAKVKIRNPNMALLRQALLAIAKELGVGVVENFEVVGWGGRRVKAVLAIPMRLPYGNGYGIVIENGEVKVVADDHGAPLTVEQFAEKLTQYYTALAVVAAAQQLGWRVSSFQQLQQGIMIDLETP